MITIRNIQKHYEDNGTIIEVFSNASLSIKENGLYGLKGVSGSGKTTLIKILTRSIFLDQGSILVKGVDITSLNKEEFNLFSKEHISFMPQSSILNLNHTVKQNIKTLLNASELEFNEAFFIESSHHFNVPNKKVKHLSAGEKQRALFLFTIMNDREIMIFDEPTSSSDLGNSKNILKYLNKLSKNKIIIVSSNKEEELENYIHHLIDIQNNKLSLKLSTMGLKNIDNKMLSDYKSVRADRSITTIFKNNTRFYARKYLVNVCITLLIMLSCLTLSAVFLNNEDQDLTENLLYVRTENIEKLDHLINKGLALEYAKYSEYTPRIILHRNSVFSEADGYDVISFNDNYANLHIVGNLPKNDNEVVVPKFSNYKIGDYVEIISINGSDEMKVVGITYTNHVFVNRVIMESLILYNFLLENQLNFELNP